MTTAAKILLQNCEAKEEEELAHVYVKIRYRCVTPSRGGATPAGVNNNNNPLGRAKTDKTINNIIGRQTGTDRRDLSRIVVVRQMIIIINDWNPSRYA